MIRLRYRFESLDVYARHLRLGDGLYLPLRPQPGSRVAIEVSWPESPDPVLLHGRIRKRTRHGSFVDLPPTWMVGPLGASRGDRRVPCDLVAEVKPFDGAPYLCRALDVSQRGVRLATGAFDAGLMGDRVAITLLVPDAMDIPSRIAWSGPPEAGLELLETPPALVSFLAACDAQWEELSHDAGCLCSRTELRAG